MRDTAFDSNPARGPVYLGAGVATGYVSRVGLELAKTTKDKLWATLPAVGVATFFYLDGYPRLAKHYAAGLLIGMGARAATRRGAIAARRM